jgi:RNA polymerase sigma factor (sigma-70 family)
MTLTLTPLELQKIQEVARALAPSFTFGIYDEDDIFQEAVLFGIECLPRYDVEQSQLKTFLYTHIRNRLINLKRNHTYRKDPCNTCQDNDSCEIAHQCKMYTNWRQRQNVINPISFTDSMTSTIPSEESPILEALSNKEILSLIDKKLPVEYRKDYILFLDGVTITKKKRLKLVEILTEILREWQDEENQP